MKYFEHPHCFEPPDNKIGEPTSVMIRLNLIDRIGYFDPTFRQFADFEMWLRILAHTNVSWLNHELAGFRIHPQQTTWENAQSDRVWGEIYGVWYKLLTDAVYRGLPRSVKERIFAHVFLELGRQWLRIIKHRKGHRFSTFVFWLQKFVYARFILTS